MGICWNYFKCCLFSWIIIKATFETTLDHDFDTRNAKGLFPNVFNLAATSNITANATCGETKTGAEIYCKLVEHVFREDEKRGRTKSSKEPQCGLCDSTSSSPDKRHPISNAIDGTNRWWQSPTLQNGKQYEWVTIALDLGEVYQIAYVIVKAAVSPRPGNWILERSIDGIIYKPWQYYSLTDSECWETYGIRPTVGKPRYRTDDEVICTSYYSKLNPLENGEIHTSLVNGRPGVDGPSMKLREFTKARYVRLRLQKIKTLNADLMTLQSDDPERIDKSVTRRYFYSIKDISIGGQCVCSGHAENCSSDSSTGKQRCICEHNTCGENCQRCCPLFNQKPWRPGTSLDGAACEKCECYGHADRCHYDQKVADEKRSINTAGRYEGGGVCDGCKHHTTGINCEQCEDEYYRPANVLRNHTRPCKKCQCSKQGMTGICVKDDSHRIEGLQPGDCLCKPGFTGKECDQCAIGYRNYPRCDPCPCHSAGTVGGTTCEGDCVCKVHVEGSRCEKCKPGYYHLSADNPDGCSQCFCFGATDECTEGDWGVELIEKMEDWRVTDIRGRRVVRPTPENGNLVIANDEVSQFSSYYWLAPLDYLGKKLYSYGADLKFTVSYVVARGDTSGTHTESADVILEGNGNQFGYKWGARPEVDTFSITMPLREQGWFHLNPSGDNVGSVSREAFSLALNNVTRILIRAKFHTDQVEGRLHNVGMEIASKESKSLKKLESVEKCVCPPGYDGLSCEKCASGYRETGKNTGFGIICQRCDCYNHAESCDADTGRCRNCLHNTTGLKCDRCVRGYYGDATIGTPDDCKSCACPLEIPENNFSPSCTAVRSSDGGSDYICDLCSEGFEGDKCERCAEGYFGNPQIPGGYCQPCDCSGNADTSQPGWCDRLTGQCLKCLGNTAGWNCGECLAGHYGNPERQNCQPCSCNHHGSISPQCDHSTGQCVCKPHFVGRTCNRCADGFGNVETGCEPCKCNKVGSRTETCDPVTGICFCKPGVFGVTCDSCLEGHYGFSRQGCLECNCSPLGAVSPQCNEDNGKCSCKPHVTGRACDRCEDGFWNINSGRGCEECQCNRTGSVASLCDKHTGQCSCKTGVGGKYCDQCLPGYYKFSGQGCRKCDPCDIPGHICDPNNGRCVCPPYTTGRRCQKCVPNAWGHNPLTGCTPCNCNTQGTPSQACDPNTGKCVCLEGFEGRHCDQCRHGFYNFPVCSKCDCSVAGTDSSRCQLKDGVCQCNERGDCVCKENVMGQKCSQCIEGAFSLTVENPKGCHQCFCFGRTQKCNQANMAWSRVPLPSRDVFMEVGTSEIPAVLGFQVIPNDLPGRRLGIPYVLDKPLYWNLPKEALGDKVLSYNGFLTFQVEGHSQSHFPDALLKQYPVVVLQGNHRLVLVHHPPSEKLRGSYRVQLYESEWKLRDNPKIPVRKEVLMVALQNVQAILIRATDGPDVKYARMHNVSLDTAATSYQPSYVAEGTEMCRCPRQYVGASCQDPAPGFYRKRKPNYLDSKDVLDLVGWAEPCSCNNHTNICDRETGVCIDCSGNTMGPNCDQCMKGFYGDPTRGPCRPCACPRPTNSFSDTCVPDAVDYVCIDCQTGYTGRHCERCASGFYGDPLREGGRCVPCDCNTYGSQGRDCDQYTGQCRCHEGISGRDCTTCSHGFILTEYGCKSCEDECTGILLNELYQMQLQLDNTNFTAIPRLPWGYLNRLYKEEQELRPLVSEYQRIAALGNNLTFEFDLAARADMLYVKAKENIVKSTEVSSDAKKTVDEAQRFLEEIGKIFHQIRDLVSELQKLCTTDPTGPGISAETLLRKAEEMLREIKRRNFGGDKADADSELSKARNLLDKIKKFTVDHGHLDDLKQRIDVLNNLLDDIIKKINNDVLQPVERGSGIIQTNRLRNNELKRVVDGISGILDNCNATLKEAADLLGKARRDVIDAAVKFQSLPGHLRDLENATDKLDVHRSILGRLNSQYKDEFVIPAQRHADELEKQSQYLNNQFSATRKLSEFPLEAAKAYQNIIDAINDAEVAAEEADRAAVNAYRQAYPETDDALVDQAAKSKERSIQLLMEAEMLSENKVPELEEELNARKHDLDKLGEDIAVGRRRNDIINRKLDAMPKGIRDSLREVEGKLRVASGKADTANNVVDHINEEIENNLKPKLEKLQAGTVDSLDLARMIQKARDDVRNASTLAKNADASARRAANQNSIVALNLKKLKDKIFLARQKASSIHVAVTVNKEEKCVRSFKPIIEPSTTNNIILNYAIKSDKSNSMLFFLGSPTEEDFMAIEMVNRKIRFLWNAGGGTQVIEHDKRIETNSEQLLKNSQWFKIEVNRIGNLATLSVKRTPEGQKPDPSEVTGASPVGFTKMDLDSTSKFFIGGFPENFVKPSEMRTSSFAGCLYEVTLDGKPVGLWNFLSNDGCDGCKEGATEEIDISAYEFQGGKSYAIMSRIPYYKKSDLYIALSFKTLNEDGLLFFAGNPNVGDFISLELKEGKVVYQLKFGGRNHLTLQTSKKYNTGNWIRVEAAREKYQAQMLVEAEMLEESGSKQGSAVLDLQHMPIYFGGVPPNFTKAHWPGITFVSYFGCMKNLQIDTTPFALSRGSVYGMTGGCSNRPMKVATFKGSGFLELNSQPILSDSSFTFSFYTNQKDALLLVSTFSGQDNDPEKLQNYYSVSVKDGKIEARFDSGTGEISMVSDQMLTSGVFHTVDVIRKNRKLVLRVDDVEEAEIRLSRGARDISAPEAGGLFIGGVKDGVSIDNMVASPQKLIGIITDVVFNGKLMRFENTVGHRGVDFGQPDVSSVSTDFLQQMALSHPSESCYSSYALLEKDTVSFGGGSEDFIQYNFDKKELSKNFNISLEFRTFHENGILFTVKNDQKRQRLAVHLRENYVIVDFRKKKAEHKNILSNTEMSQGDWHMVGLVKSGKILSLYLNKKKIASTHIPKRLAFKSPLYIAGVPADARSQIGMATTSYRGCIRSFKINGSPRKVPKTDRLCFSDIERGLYFTGRGYATYDLSSRNDKEFVISILFRTTQLNGNLLTFHDALNQLWFKLELLDGEVLVTVYDERNSQMFKISNRFDSKYDVCDNKWHTVMTAYKGSTLTLHLDRLKSVHREVEKPTSPFEFTSLYIGGTPSKYHKIFSSEYNFVGCLQSLTVNGQDISFERVKTSSNTVHNSCPQL